MSNYILFIFEGEKTEKKIVNNLTKFFISENNTVIQCAYCNNIYKLYKDIDNDEFLDTFVLLKEIDINKKILSNFERNDFAEIYLFFDYDGHDTLANDKKVREVLNFFNEETSAGKLLISYPMVEALKHFSDDNTFKFLKVKAKHNIHYKKIVSKEANKKLINFNSYTKEDWITLLNCHLKKMNYIVNNKYKIPNNSHSQIKIFKNQVDKYINNDCTVAVLSSFPIFLFEYYGVDFINNLLLE